MRILFAGSPEIAVPALEALSSRFEVVGVLTNPDRVKGRGKKVLPTAVKSKAQELGLPVIQHEHLYRAARADVVKLSPDILVTFAYGRIFGPKFLELFPLGGVNVHPSLLPQFRGSTPIQSAILAGLEETGITIQSIALEMDAGDILGQIRLPLTGRETTETLSKLVADTAPGLLADVLEKVKEQAVHPRVQDGEKATFCSFIEKEQALIDWNKSAVELSREIRAYYPWPKSYTTYKGRTLMLTYALPFDDEIPGVSVDASTPPGTVLGAVAGHGIIIATGKGLLGVTRLQLQAKREMDWKSFINGNSGFIGSHLPDCR